MYKSQGGHVSSLTFFPKLVIKIRYTKYAAKKPVGQETSTLETSLQNSSQRNKSKEHTISCL